MTSASKSINLIFRDLNLLIFVYIDLLTEFRDRREHNCQWILKNSTLVKKTSTFLNKLQTTKDINFFKNTEYKRKKQSSNFAIQGIIIFTTHLKAPSKVEKTKIKCLARHGHKQSSIVTKIALQKSLF